MYRHLYGLTQKPFQISTDPSFLWMGNKHREALAVMVYGVRNSKGFLLLSGGVGTGKTTLIHSLLSRLDKHVVVATVQDPSLTPMAFFNFIAHAYGMRRRYTNKVDFLFAFEKFLRKNRAAGRSVLLIVDEAQRLDQTLLEEIRLLSNIEDPDQKLLNVFFVGQEEFLDIIAAPVNRALKQRITVNYHLDALDLEETEALVRHRLKVAGASRAIFSPDAFPLIHQFSQGAPRLVNILCDHALLSGFVKDVDIIGADIIAESIEDLMLPGELPRSLPVPGPEAVDARPVAAAVTAGLMLQNSLPPTRRPRWPWAAAAAGLLLAIGLGVFMEQGGWPLSKPVIISRVAPDTAGKPSPPEETPTAVVTTDLAKPDAPRQTGSSAPLPKGEAQAPARKEALADGAGNAGEEKALFASRPGRPADREAAGTVMAAPSQEVASVPPLPEAPKEETALIGHEVPDPLPPDPVYAEEAAGGAETDAEAELTVAITPPAPPPLRIAKAPGGADTGISPAALHAGAPAAAKRKTPGRQPGEVLNIAAGPAPLTNKADDSVPRPATAIPGQASGGLPTPAMVETSGRAPAQTDAVRPAPLPSATRIATTAAPPPSPAAEDSRTKPPAPALLPAYSIEDRLRDFISAYSQAYESRDLERLRLFFAKDAVENGRPFSTVLPIYRKNFAALAGLEYTIDRMSWEKDDATGRIALKGIFHVRYHMPNRDWRTTRGEIAMVLVSNKGVYRVKRLEYKKKGD